MDAPSDNRNVYELHVPLELFPDDSFLADLLPNHFENQYSNCLQDPRHSLLQLC